MQHMYNQFPKLRLLLMRIMQQNLRPFQYQVFTSFCIFDS